MSIPPSPKRAKAGQPDVTEVVEAEWTWINGRFEEGVRVGIGGGGDIAFVVQSGGGAAPAGAADAAAVRRLPGQALLPGFVNCHSHAFQRGLRGLGESYPEARGESSFWTWREDMYRLVGSLDAGKFYALARQCFEEMRAVGITSVGEFHYLHHPPAGPRWALDAEILRAAADAGVRCVLLLAYYEYAGFGRKPLSDAQQRFATPSLEEYWAQFDAAARAADASTQTVGVVAHSLRAVDTPELQALREGAARRGVPFHLHLEEQPQEVRDCEAEHGATPMALLLRACGAGGAAAGCGGVTAVHCNHTDPGELRRFAAGGGTVCVCPLTEGNLGDGVMRDLSACNGRVCFGTDCNARIDFFEEMRSFEYGQRLARLRRGVAVAARRTAGAAPPDDVAVELLRCATEHGAASLSLRAGAIAPGLAADFCAVDLRAPCLAGATRGSLLAALVFGAAAAEVVAGVCVAGRWRPPRVTPGLLPAPGAAPAPAAPGRAQL